MVRLFEGAGKNKKYVFSSIILAIVFWLIQYGYQLYFNIEEIPGAAVIRSAAFTSATLIGLALLAGPLARIFPSKNYVVHRRTLGVLGFTFAIVHVIAVISFYFNFQVLQLFFDLNPYANPIIFGVIAFLVYIPLYLTSTDWAVQKLNFKRWKAIHRLVYIAWILTVLHFAIINTAILNSAPGYLLLLVTALVFIFEITAFYQYTKQRPGKGWYIGFILILIGLILSYFAISIKQNIVVSIGIPVIILGVIVLSLYLRSKKKKISGTSMQSAKESQLS